MSNKMELDNCNSESLWAELLNHEIQNNIKDKILTAHIQLNDNKSKSKKDIKEPKENSEKTNSKNLSLNDIVNLDYKNITFPKLVDYQTTIAKYLKNHLKQTIDTNTEIELESYIKKIEWLLNTSKYSSDLLKQNDVSNDDTVFNKNGIPDNLNKINSKNLIPRSSYKFCKYNHDCKYIVKCHKNTLTNGQHVERDLIIPKRDTDCFEQHFVFNYVFFDIKCVLNYIQTNKHNLNLSEILKCLNTIYYVFNHMNDELQCLLKNKSFNLNSLFQ